MNRDHLAMAAAEDQESVVDLTRALVRVPSRGGVDPYDPVLDQLGGWLTGHHLPTRVLTDQTGAIVGLTCEVRGARPGPRWVLDACLDTAGFGDESAWTHPPTSAVVDDGWLWGRGSADSKAGAAIFCQLAVRLAARAPDLHGSLVLLFDVDEHTGGFGSARRYFEGPDAPDDVAGVMIGYPGMDKLVVGGRGVHRARLHVHGVAAHSGGSATVPSAVHKAADLIGLLSTTALPAGATDDFPLPGRLTVTAVSGGHGFSTTPTCAPSTSTSAPPRGSTTSTPRTTCSTSSPVSTEPGRTPAPPSSSSTPAGPPTHSHRTHPCAPRWCQQPG